MSAPTGPRAFGTHDLDQFARRMAELKVDFDPSTDGSSFVAHTDGACFGNPEGPGGWGAVVEQLDQSPPLRAPWLLWGHLSSTSNNRAEALGVLAALEWVPPRSELTVMSDSELTVRILQGRYKARANGDIWEVIRRTLANKELRLTPEWLRGHAGDPRNELADQLSRLGASNAPRTARVDLDTASLAAAAPAAARERSGGAKVPPELADLKPQGDWERQFVRSLAQQLRGKRPLSPKQQAIVDKIRARGSDGGV